MYYTWIVYGVKADVCTKLKFKLEEAHCILDRFVANLPLKVGGKPCQGCSRGI